MNVQRMDVAASEVRVGDRLDIALKNRVAQVSPGMGYVIAKTRVRGSRSPSIEIWTLTKTVRVWRPVKDV